MKFKKTFHLLIDFIEREGIDHALIDAFSLKVYRYIQLDGEIL